MGSRGLLKPQVYGSSGGGGSARKYGELLSGAVNGINKVFTASVTFPAATVVIKLNGITLFPPADFTVTGGDEVTLTEAPKATYGQTDRVTADYDLS